MHSLVSVLTIVACAGVVCAAPYSGLGPGSSVIDAGGSGDYVSLNQAVQAINAEPLTGGDWTFLIRSDLLETTNSALAQSTNGNKITLRPDADCSVTVSFLVTRNPVGFKGHILIGTRNPEDATTASFVKTDSVVIDGSNNGSQSRNMTLRKMADSNTSFSPIIQVVGNCDGVQVRNCTVQGERKSYGTFGQISPAIEYVSFIREFEGALDLYPDNGLVENNDICAPDVSWASTTGIASNQIYSGSGSQAQDGQTSMVVRGNTIYATKYGIYLDSNKGADVLSNTLSLEQELSSSGSGTHYCVAIAIGRGGASALPLTTNIAGNRVIQVRSALVGQTYAAGIACSRNLLTSMTYNITNNMICSVKIAAHENYINTPASIDGIGIGYGCAAIVRHNSVRLPLSTNSWPTIAPGSCAGIAMRDYFALPYRTDADVANNIVRVDQTTGAAILRGSYLTGVFTSDFNDFYAPAGYVGVCATPCKTLSDWTAATSQDVHSSPFDPATALLPGWGRWVSLTDLHFDAFPGMPYVGTPVAEVPYDIDGDPRSSVMPTMGADETEAVTTQTAARDWTWY